MIARGDIGPAGAGGAGAASVPLDPAAHLLLATWLSPAFPLGGFSYSHGLETAIVESQVATAATLRDWIGLLVERGSGWCDALLAAEAWRAVRAGDWARLLGAADLAAAMAPSRERQLETLNLGAAFLTAVGTGWPNEPTARLAGEREGRVAYPIALGTAAAALGIPLAPLLAAQLNAFVAALVSVAVRLVPLGQSDGLRVVAGLQALVVTIAGQAERATLDQIGNAAIGSDIAAMRHETLYSRVFRS